MITPCGQTLEVIKGSELAKGTNLYIAVGPPVLIEVNMQVRSMGPISEMDMVSPAHKWRFYYSIIQSYSMDSYFRQSWVDKRLAFSGYEVI